MDTTKTYLLGACFNKSGVSKETGEGFRYMLISLTDFETQDVLKVKPYDTREFIEDVWPKAERLIGKMVVVEWAQKSYGGQLLSFIKDINEAPKK